MKTDLVILVVLVFAVNAQIYSVKDFGAKGDGRIKDTNAIKAAISKCAASNGCTVFFPVCATMCLLIN
jgi:polygalacturonase